MFDVLRPAAAVGIPVIVGFAVLANSVDLPRAVAVALYLVVIAVPVVAALRAEDRRHNKTTPSARPARSH